MYEYNFDLYLGGDWLDKTSDVRVNSGTISGGAKDESASISASTCKFTVNDPNGDYNPRNPLGAYYGDLGKNTPVRVRIPALADNVAQTDSDGWGTNWENGPSSGGTVANTDWSRSGTVCTHSVPAAGAYRRSILVPEHQYQDVCFRGSVFIEGDPSNPLPSGSIDGAEIWFEVELRYTDENNYIAAQFIMGTDETFYIQVVEVIAGTTYVLLGRTAMTGVSIQLDSTFEFAAMVEGQVVRTKIWPADDPEPKDWQTVCTRANVRVGRIALVTGIVAGNTNTKPFALRFDDLAVEYRPFVGEISEFEAGVADQSHAAPYVKITASGITRRTIQGSEPLQSAMTRYWSTDRKWIRQGQATANLDAPNNRSFRTTDADAADLADVGGIFRITRGSEGQILAFGYPVEDQMFTITGKVSAGGNTTISFTPDMLTPVKSGDAIVTYDLSALSPVAYWPCEDGKGATQIASGLTNGDPMTTAVAEPKYGESDTLRGSGPILKLNNAELNGVVPDYVDTEQAFTFHCAFHHPLALESAEAFVQLWTDSSSTEVWVLSFGETAGQLVFRVRALDVNSGVTVLFDHEWGINDFRDAPAIMIFSARQATPTTVTYSFTNTRYNQDGTVANSGGVTAQLATGVTNLGKLKRVQVDPGGGYKETAIGHIGVVNTYLEANNVRDAPGGNTGESPARRMNRLAYEENVPLVYCQGPISTMFLGPQRQDTLLDNWKDAAEFDLGRFYESRGAYSFEYRARSSLYNQEYFLDVDYTQGAVTEVDTRDDDQATRNDITVKQQSGSSYRAVDETSSLSVLPPGEGGVGRYTDAPEVSTLSPVQLPDLAHWRLALGTIDEERYPAITVQPTGDVTLAQMLSCGVGNRFRVRNLQARGKYEPIDQLVSGYELKLDQYNPTLTINGVPSSRYNIAVLGEARLDSDTSELAENLDTTETAVDVSTLNAVWTTDPAEFPFDIMVGGERMTVTAISGATSPQTFTVTRSVNGVVKTHSVGDKVSLADPVYLPL